MKECLRTGYNEKRYAEAWIDEIPLSRRRRQPYAVFVNDKPLQAPAFSLREKRSASPGGGAEANVRPVACPRSGSEPRLKSETSTEPGRVLYDD